jgi:hypothetical protein
MAAGLARAGKLGDARAIAGRLDRGVGAKYPHLKMASAYLQIARISHDKKDLTAALSVLHNHLRVHGAEIAESQALTGDVPAALQTADTLSPKLDKPDALWRIVRAQALGGDISGAKQTLTRFDPEDTMHIEQSWCVIAEARALAGDVAGTVDAAAHVQWMLRKPYAAALIAYAQAKRGHTIEARSTAEELKHGPMAEPAAAGFALGLIACADWQSGRSDDAAKELETARRLVESMPQGDTRAGGALRVARGAVDGPSAIESEGFAVLP